MTIGDNIKKLRKERNLTQKELGDLLHVSNKTISKWERSSSLPDVDTIKNIAKLFDVEYKLLIDGDQIDDDVVESTQRISMKYTWISGLYILLLIVGNYLFCKAYVIYDLHYVFLFAMISMSSIILLVICKPLIFRKNVKAILYLSVSSLNVFLLTTTVFTTEEVYVKLILSLAIYWLIVSGISYFVFNNIKTKISLIVLFIIYLFMKLIIPFVVLIGIGMSSYGNI